MFTITQKQLELMLTHDPVKFIDFVVAHVQRHCRDSVRDIDPVSLREMVTNGLARARSHGLSRAKDLTAFVAIMFEIGPNFDEQPEIRAALRDGRIAPDERFDRMLSTVSDDAWTDAERRRDSEAWFPELMDEKRMRE
jgi:hypothetical protein